MVRDWGGGRFGEGLVGVGTILQPVSVSFSWAEGLHLVSVNLAHHVAGTLSVNRY